MKRTIVTCDKCGKEIEDGNTMTLFQCDLCFDCYDQAINLFSKWLAVKPRNEETEDVPEEPKEDKRKRTKIDWDRAVELKKQGWSHEAIAKEVGTTTGTISTAIYKHMEG